MIDRDQCIVREDEVPWVCGLAPGSRYSYLQRSSLSRKRLPHRNEHLAKMLPDLSFAISSACPFPYLYTPSAVLVRTTLIIHKPVYLPYPTLPYPSPRATPPINRWLSQGLRLGVAYYLMARRLSALAAVIMSSKPQSLSEEASKVESVFHTRRSACRVWLSRHLW